MSKKPRMNRYDVPIIPGLLHFVFYTVTPVGFDGFARVVFLAIEMEAEYRIVAPEIYSRCRITVVVLPCHNQSHSSFKMPVVAPQ